MKKAFTMIELIFVIVILGILASIAVSSLAATRSDAMQATLLDNLRTCTLELATSYTASGTENLSSLSCEQVLKCFSIDRGLVLTDGEFIVSSHNNTQVDENRHYCIEAQRISDEKNTSQPLSLGGKLYSYGGDNLYY